MSISNIAKRIHSRINSAGLPEVVVGFLIIALLPQIISIHAATELLIIAIFAIGYNLLLGYGGEMSFGHAAYYATGAYGVVLVMQHFGTGIFVGMLAGIALATLVSVVFGKISLYTRGIYFAMITLALAQMTFFFFRSFGNITGGTNGAFLPPIDASIGPIALGDSLGLYVFTLLILIICLLAVRRILNSPFGLALIAVRESEARAKHLGYNSNRILLLTFTLSGLIAGIAGSLHALLFGFISPDIAYWTASGDIVLVTVMGGMGTFAGPLVGALAFIVASDIMSDLTNHWPLLLGLLFVLVVMFAPQGLYGLYKQGLYGLYTDFKQDLRERYRG